MTSNYPPNVSGREPEIAGPDAEYVGERVCGAVDVLIPAYAADDVPIMILKAQRGMLLPLVLKMATKYKIEAAACPFEGKVDIARYHDTEEWTCPVCGELHRYLIEEEEE